MKQTVLPEEDWTLVGKGKVVEAEKRTVEPAEETILGESEDQGLGKFQVPAERGNLVEEVSGKVATASQVSPKSLEIIPFDSTKEGKDVQVSQATALQSQSEESAEACLQFQQVFRGFCCGEAAVVRATMVYDGCASSGFAMVKLLLCVQPWSA
ncbi:hypothetical protein U1Q18_010132 [Sarracenia purpurea var. burkii]